MPEFHEDLAAKLITRPDAAYHSMRLKRPAHKVTARIGDVELASSTHAIKLFEIGRDLYEPLIYFPRSDVAMNRLQLIEGKSTHCPLKGDTEYFSALTPVGVFADAAWSYNRPLDWAAELKDCIAFDETKVEVREHKGEVA